MWIVPKTLSAFVQDTEGLNLDLEERAWMLESSAMWRSKPSSKQTWLRRLKKDSWMTHLSTRILKPSQQKSFEEKFVASWEDIPVSRSVARESEKERKTQDTCGHTSESMSGQLDLFGAFSKMSEVTPRWGYGESCPIWKKMVTERSGDCTQRRKQARLTNASDASSWRNYPTPTALEEKYRIGGNTQASKNLTAMARRGELNSNWATPNTMDYMETRSAEGVEKIASGARKGRKRPSNLREQVDKKTCDIYNQLNWPTPRAGNPGSRKPGTGGKILAEEAKKNWGTPASNDANKTPHCEINSKQGGLSKSVGIEEAKKNWATPQSTDGDRAHQIRKRSELSEKAKKGGCRNLREDVFNFGPPAPEKSSTSGKNHGSPKLNPNWVEQLMGLPIGWTDLGSWATESSHKPQN